MEEEYDMAAKIAKDLKWLADTLLSRNPAYKHCIHGLLKIPSASTPFQYSECILGRLFPAVWERTAADKNQYPDLFLPKFECKNCN